MMITIDGVWKKYGRSEALRGLDLAIPQGSAFAILGANGAGKTTMIRTIMNMLAPDRGHIEILGVDSRTLGPDQYQRIGFVSENQRLPERLSVAAFLAYLRPMYADWDRDLELALLRQLELPGDRKIRDLSHGMRIKLQLLAALAYRPQLLVLDEPFTGLDPLVRDEFVEGLIGQAGEATILISSHELHEIEGLATHVAYIDRGRCKFQEPIEALQSRVREVRLVLDGQSAARNGAPAHWLNIRSVGNAVSFVDTQFTEAGLMERLSGYFGPIRDVEFQPIGLRPIFTTIARSLREEGL